jgi:WhiB family redox-sensing transcriptional regulator
MLALLTLAEQPGCSLTGADIQRRLIELQGKNPGWKWRHQSSVVSYCERGLIPAGLVEKVNTADDGAASYQVTKLGLEIGVPLFGSLLDLELRAGISLQEVFGSTNSNNLTANHMRGPLVRMQIFEHINMHNGEPISLRDLEQQIPREKQAISHCLQELEKADIIRILNKTDPADRQLTLVKPNTEKLARYRPFMKPASAAVHDVAVRLYRRGFRDLTGEQLLEEVLQANRHNPTLQAQDIWRAVTNAKGLCFKFSDAHLYGSNTGKNAPRTRIGFTPRAADTISEMIGNIKALSMSSTYRLAAARWAMSLLHEPTSVAYLMAKARHHSKLIETGVQDQLRLSERKALTIGHASLKRQLTIDVDWRNRAACQDIEPSLFFSEDDEDIPTDVQAQFTEAAKRICSSCTEQLACLKSAVEMPEAYGIWGGHTSEERERLDPALAGLINVISLRN